MIRTETIGDRVRTYSDAGLKLRQLETGILYDDAIDVEGLHTYTETDMPIEDDLTDSEVLSIIMGRDSDEPSDGE